MSRNKKIVIGVIVVVVLFIGMGLLRWSSRVYWLSGGERGWSPGASVYQMMGWGMENYMADMGFQRGEAGWTSEVEVRLVDDNEDGVYDRGVVTVPAGIAYARYFGRQAPLNEVQLVDDDGDGVPDRGVIDYPAYTRFGKFGHHDKFGPGFGPGRHPGGGFACLLLLAVIAGAGIYFYRRRRASTSTDA